MPVWRYPSFRIAGASILANRLASRFCVDTDITSPYDSPRSRPAFAGRDELPGHSAGGQTMRRFARIVGLLASVVLLPVAAFAQGAIAGQVKDASGAVLPGVTVEAASPVLIEKARNVVSDGSGNYRIENLRPGTYTVTFTLTGFSSVKRDDVMVSGSAVTEADATLRVGNVAETITVTAESPVVDTASKR